MQKCSSRLGNHTLNSYENLIANLKTIRLPYFVINMYVAYFSLLNASYFPTDYDNMQDNIMSTCNISLLPCKNSVYNLTRIMKIFREFNYQIIGYMLHPTCSNWDVINLFYSFQKNVFSSFNVPVDQLTLLLKFSLIHVRNVCRT